MTHATALRAINHVPPLAHRRPHVVHITTLPQTAISFLEGQLRYLQQHGYDVTVISSPSDRLCRFAASEGIRYGFVPMTRAVSPWRDARSLRQLCQILRRIRPDIVHSHTPKAGLLGMMAARLTHTPLAVYQMHGLRSETSAGVRGMVLRSAERFSCRLADQVLCVSPSLRSKAVQQGIIAEGRATVLHNGSVNGLDSTYFDPTRFGIQARRDVRRRLRIPHHASVIGFVGRLVNDKGVSELVSAWQTLKVQFPHLHLLLVGPFEQEDTIPTGLQRALMEDPRVHLTGLDWDPLPYYTAMDVFVLPSRREGFGIVLLEAAAMELPTVATRVTGCVDAIQDGATGTLVPANSPHGIADAVARYVQVPHLARKHGVAGRRRVIRDFRPVDIWQALDRFYARLLEIRPVRVIEERRLAA